MPTPPDAAYKQRQHKPVYATLWHGRGRSRAHPQRRYIVHEDGSIWRAEKWRARFSKKP